MALATTTLKPGRPTWSAVVRMTRRRPLLLAFVLLAAPALAGCTGPSGAGSLEDPWSGAPDLSWGVLDANTTAAEPWEAQGALFVSWTADTFMVHASNEGDLPVWLLRTEDTVYTTYTRMGWVATPIAEAVGPEPTVSNRLILWDLRGLLGSAGLDHDQRKEGANTVYTAKGALQYGGQPLSVDARVVTEGGRIVEATVDSDEGREAPFSFLPPEEGMAVPAFPEGVPVASKVTDQATVDAKDPVAQQDHARIISLIRAYARNHGGLLPEEVTPEEMRAEMLVEGGDWPTGAYDDKPLSAQEKSGHFAWVRCGNQDGRYTGYGWDGLLVEQAFGRGCA